jgi:PhnB protein
MAIEANAIAPWLTVRDGEAALEFYRNAFGAQLAYRLSEAEPDVVARLAIGDAEFWVSDGRAMKPHRRLAADQCA